MGGQALRLQRGAVALCVLGESRDHGTAADAVIILDRDTDPGAINGAFEAAAQADVVVIHEAVRAQPGWLDRLRAAATCDSTVGAAVPLLAGGGVLGIGAPIPEDSFEQIASLVAERSARTRPRIPATAAGCIYLRREAIDLVGPLDTGLGTVDAALTDFLERCLMHGLQEVVADDLLVLDGRPSAGVGASAAIAERYRWARQASEVATTRTSGPLARARGNARRTARGLTLTFDARILHDFLSGTQIHVLEVIQAVARARRARLRLVVSPELGGEPAALLDQIDAERVPAAEVADATTKTDVVHRSHQVFSLDDVTMLQRLGERIVISQQDLIAYRNPAYHSIPEYWLQYRRATRLALASADAFVSLSQHALDDALADELVDPTRCHVLAIGTEHLIGGTAGAPRRPAGLRIAEPDGFLLYIGTDFLHKNIPFAMRLLGLLRRDHGWQGGLVVAGPSVRDGSSVAEEARYLEADPELREVVERIGPVDEAEKAWLMANAAALVYPSSYEGFGLVPFEAARAGTPCVWAPQGSLGEVLPEELATLVPWDAAASAERALPLLRDEAARVGQVEAVRKAAAALPDWDAHAEALFDIYERASSSPSREASALAAEAVERERELAEWNALKDELGADGFGLVRAGGYLPADIQTALLSIVTRPRLRDPFFATLRGIYRAGHGLRGGKERQARK
jgi:glycosyltransferase involved in cell wall biosynthesis